MTKQACNALTRRLLQFLTNFQLKKIYFYTHTGQGKVIEKKPVINNIFSTNSRFFMRKQAFGPINCGMNQTFMQWISLTKWAFEWINIWMTKMKWRVKHVQSLRECKITNKNLSDRWIFIVSFFWDHLREKEDWCFTIVVGNCQLTTLPVSLSRLIICYDCFQHQTRMSYGYTTIQKTLSAVMWPVETNHLEPLPPSQY